MIVLLYLLACGDPPALAQAPDPFTVPCEGVTQVEINGCAADSLHRELQRLEAAQAAAMADAEDDQRELLVRSNEAFEAYRTAECERRRGAYTGGSMAPMVGALCAAELTRERSLALESPL
jgi:uncharacterized protein YecT (DUF1311 family)